MSRTVSRSSSTGSFRCSVATVASLTFRLSTWMVRYEIARQKAIDAWMDITTPRPEPAGEEVQAKVRRLREAAQARQRVEARQTCIRAPAGLEAHVNAVGLPEATEAMNEATVETVWRGTRRARVGLFPISNNLAAVMALVTAGLRGRPS